MNKHKEASFRLDTDHTSYLFRISKFGHLEHVYYGSLLSKDDKAEFLSQKRSIQVGSSIHYSKDDDAYSLDSMCLEWSDNGRGDYRQSPSEFIMPDGSFVSDFIYDSHEVHEGCVPMKGLPTAYGANQTLRITLKDKVFPIYIDLYYSIFGRTDVITRRAVVRNEGTVPLTIHRIMSMSGYAR